MGKKILSLGSEGKLVLKSPDGMVEDIARPRNASAYLLVDCSSSMEGTKLAQAQEGSMEFAKGAVTKGYSVGLIQFASEAKLLQEPTRGISALYPHVEKLMANGSTNMTDGIKMAIERLGTIDGLRAIVVVTDGMPDDPKTTLNTVQQAKERGIDVIAIGTDDADRDFLNKLASRADLAAKVSRDKLGQSIASAAKLLPGKRE